MVLKIKKIRLINFILSGILFPLPTTQMNPAWMRLSVKIPVFVCDDNFISDAPITSFHATKRYYLKHIWHKPNYLTQFCNTQMIKQNYWASKQIFVQSWNEEIYFIWRQVHELKAFLVNHSKTFPAVFYCID